MDVNWAPDLRSIFDPISVLRAFRRDSSPGDAAEAAEA
jgi:hypothetical protein